MKGNRMNTQKKDLKSVVEQLSRYEGLVLEWQTELTEIPAIGPENGGNGEAGKSRIIKKLLNDIGIDELIELNAPDSRVPDGYRPNLLARLNGHSSKRTLWIMSHMDIVPEGDRQQWETDPFHATLREGRIYGRGTEDDQQGIISSLLLLKALRDQRVTPPFDLCLAIVSDEEAGSLYGIQYVLQNRADLFRKTDWIIIPDAGNKDGTMIEVAEKSILWVKFDIKGKQTHASTPEKGINAHTAGAHLIIGMENLRKRFNQSDPVYDPPVSTFEPTKKETNVENINTIPGHDVVYFDCRLLPAYSLDSLKTRIQEIAGEVENRFRVQISISYAQDVSAPPPTPADTPVAVALKQAIRAVLNREAKSIGIGGGTVAAYFREAGLPAVCWCTVDDTLHAPNEYSKIENMLNDAKVFAHVCMHP
jgi:succinyl-diaminopimelate desuccinylase